MNPHPTHIEAVADAAASSMPGGEMTCNCKPREQWRFTGRETHWGYVYLVWTRDDGKRWARWVQAPETFADKMARRSLDAVQHETWKAKQ